MTGLTTDLRIPAAQYIRMSTEHQRYSLDNQTAAIAEFAEERGFAIVQTYADAGKSGLSLKGRDGLKQLLADVVTGQHGYSAILVLDVSRWGRFQDTDQSAHYEFLCRDAGVAVEYCGEPFENDGSIVSTIVKNLKRVMAGEYSRELSAKISRAKKQQAGLGFRQGGGMPYGVRRLLVSKSGEPRCLLGAGEQKGLSTDRVVFVPGPPEEIAIVRRIFRQFVTQKQSMTTIAKRLNADGVPSTNGSSWTRERVRTVLSSELMIGNYVYNRTNARMRGPIRPNPPEQWVRVRVLDQPVVDIKQFAKAQREIGDIRRYTFAKPDMIARLRRLLREKKKLSSTIIDNCPYTPCSSSYGVHFGGLHAAYEIIGFKCRAIAKRGREYSDEELLDGIRRLHAKFGYVSIALINADPELPMCRVFVERFGSIIRAYGLAGFPSTRAGVISAVRKRASQRVRKYSDDELLDGIRRLRATFGHVTIALIDADPELPKCRVFVERFGSIVRACCLAGFPTTRAEAVSAALKRARVKKDQSEELNQGS